MVKMNDFNKLIQIRLLTELYGAWGEGTDLKIDFLDCKFKLSG